MKIVVSWPISLLLVAGTLLTGCDLETIPRDPPKFSPANNMVVNEVFTLPFTSQNFHSWVEMYNPTNQTIDMRGWTLSFGAPRFFLEQILPKDTITDSLGFRWFYLDPIDIGFAIDSSFTPADVPLATSRTEIKAGQLFTIASDRNLLEVFTDLGPGPGIARFEQIIEGPVDTSKVPVDSSYSNIGIPDTIRFTNYVFILSPTAQLILKDSSGNVVDVVRYGNYAWPGPGADPYPNNQSMGFMPEYYSIARYAGAYWTGNTANDFYFTNSRLRPLPHYYSQAFKP
ncbi:MAG TPA: hypothetical protein VGB89_05705 [Bacteroidota bacterium]